MILRIATAAKHLDRTDPFTTCNKFCRPTDCILAKTGREKLASLKNDSCARRLRIGPPGWHEFGSSSEKVVQASVGIVLQT